MDSQGGKVTLKACCEVARFGGSLQRLWPPLRHREPPWTGRGEESFSRPGLRRLPLMLKPRECCRAAVPHNSMRGSSSMHRHSCDVPLASPRSPLSRFGGAVREFVLGLLTPFKGPSACAGSRTRQRNHKGRDGGTLSAGRGPARTSVTCGFQTQAAMLRQWARRCPRAHAPTVSFARRV